jgi:hypothetical protein
MICKKIAFYFSGICGSGWNFALIDVNIIKRISRVSGNNNNYSAINVNVDCIPLILVIDFPIDSFIVSILLSDNFTIISYGPSTLFTSITQANLLS